MATGSTSKRGRRRQSRPEFHECLRSSRHEDLAADIEVGHYGTAICHQANVAWRAGAAASVDEVRESMRSHDDAADSLYAILKQLDGYEVDLTKQPFVLGPQLTYDRQQEKFVGTAPRRPTSSSSVPTESPSSSATKSDTHSGFPHRRHGHNGRAFLVCFNPLG
jgi:hypothetical protein